MKVLHGWLIGLSWTLAVLPSVIFAQTREDHISDSIKTLASAAPSIEEKIEIAYKACETLQRAKPDAVLAITRWMKSESEEADYPYGLGLAHEQTGNAYYYKRKADSSIYYYKAALKLYQSGKKELKVFTIYNYLVFSYRLAGMKDSTVFYVKKEVEQAKVTNDSANWATALHDDGFHQSENNQLSAAIHSFFEALKYVKKDAYNTQINIYNGIGDCYHVMGNDSAALKYFYSSLNVANNIPTPGPRKEYWLALSLNRIASTFLELKDSVNALRSIRQQLLHASQTDDREQLYTAHLNYGMYYTNTRQYDSSIYHFNEGLKIEKAVGRKRAIGIIHYNMAGAYNDKKDFRNALKHADSAQNIFATLITKIWQSKNYHALAAAYAGLGRHREAYESLQSFVATNGELMTQDNNRKIAQMQAEYDVVKKDAAISLLNKDNDLKKSERNFFIAVAASLLLMALLILYQFRQKQKLNAILTDKNIAIEHSLKERETLLKEIHHRVKNNLQIISSLLSLQSKNLTDEAAQSAVTESRNRVKSMSLIHEQLYTEDNLAGVSMPEYIDHLVQSLAGSYGVNREKIELAMDSEPFLLDVDTAIPIGLILNELVSNSLKYAFPNDQSGTLTVSLKQANGELKLCVADNGVGMKESAKNNNSFGLSLVNSLMRKLKAEMNFFHENGTRVELRIKDFKIVGAPAIAS